MSRLQVGTENGAPIELHYQDYGSGKPVVLIHFAVACVRELNQGFEQLEEQTTV